MPTLDDRLLPVFAAQHWLVSTADIALVGGSSHHVRTRLLSGRWIRVDACVFRLDGTPQTWHGRLLAPILSAGSGAVASHFAAASLHRIPGFGPGVPELSVARGTKFRREGVVVHTSTDLDRCTVTVVDGIPTTDMTRTLLDIARRVGDRRLLRAIEHARRVGGITWSDLIRTLHIHARRGRPGIRRLRRVIAANVHRDEVTDTDFELLVLALLAENGLPEPVLHHRAADRGRFVGEVDLAYPDRRIAIELDGGVHLEAEVRERDLPRQNDLILCGWLVLRFTYARFRDRPESLVAEVRAALQRPKIRELVPLTESETS